MSVNVFLLLIHTEYSQLSVMSLPTAGGRGHKPGLLLLTQHACTLTRQLLLMPQINVQTTGFVLKPRVDIILDSSAD